MAAPRTLNPFVQVRVLARQPSVRISGDRQQTVVEKQKQPAIFADCMPLVVYASKNMGSEACFAAFLCFYPYSWHTHRSVTLSFIGLVLPTIN